MAGARLESITSLLYGKMPVPLRAKPTHWGVRGGVVSLKGNVKGKQTQGKFKQNKQKEQVLDTVNSIS